MDTALFQRFADLVYEQAGITLRPGKEALVHARVAKRLRALSLPDEAEYLRFLEQDESGDELVHFLDAISTNFTSFFRESDHFENLRDHVQNRLAEGQNRLRIWCAAASSGEEPYSIAMTVHEVIEHRRVDFRMLATDISTKVLHKAMTGEYDASRLTSLTPQQMLKYFTRVDDGEGHEEKRYVVSPVLRDYIVFKRLNLSTPPFPMSGPMDVVFCRNVMIYFDNAVRQRLVAEIERLLAPGAILFVGHTETLTGINTGLRMVRPSVYWKPE